jgi:hypothetical protein
MRPDTTAGMNDRAYALFKLRCDESNDKAYALGIGSIRARAMNNIVVVQRHLARAQDHIFGQRFIDINL